MRKSLSDFLYILYQKFFKKSNFCIITRLGPLAKRHTQSTMFNICAVINSNSARSIKNISSDILIQSTDKTMSIIKVIIEELNNTILKDNINHRSPVITFLCGSNCISKSRILCKGSFKQFFLAGKSTIRWDTINTNGKSYITKFNLLRKDLLKGSNLITIVASKNDRRIIATNIYIASNLRISIK